MVNRIIWFGLVYSECILYSITRILTRVILVHRGLGEGLVIVVHILCTINLVEGVDSHESGFYIVALLDTKGLQSKSSLSLLKDMIFACYCC